MGLGRGVEARLITENPLFFILLALNIIGVQLFGVGFIAELLLRESTKKHDYTVDKKLASNGKSEVRLNLANV